MIRVFRGQFFLMYTSNDVGPVVLNVYNSETIKQPITVPLDYMSVHLYRLASSNTPIIMYHN